MSLVLGIDTGGTYTDGVVVDRRTKQIMAKAKALTTRDDLSIGITHCIDNMAYDRMDQIDVVSLSTTLATNAIVEGRGCEVGLLMIGFAPDHPLPVRMMRQIGGGHNVKGMARAPLDRAGAREALESMRGQVDAVAISGYLSIRNPEHELETMALAKEILGVPVVCAHYLTRALGIHERTVTTVLNAKLLPIIQELMDSVKTVLRNRNISAPVMIVKGDGTLVGEEKARQKPIETLLSGPAASIIGATFLSGAGEALVLDMGGTTTDLAVIREGIPRIDEEGARVGGWVTRVEAAAINTYGVGGDSWIQLDMARRFQVGPQRVIPICAAATRHPHLVEELRAIRIPYAYLLNHAQVVDCFQLLDESVTTTLSEKDEAVVSFLRKEPHSYISIARGVDTELNLLNLNRLVNVGVLGRISVTPTDILHAKGVYQQWDRAASQIAVSLLAERFAMEYNEFIDFAADRIVDELCYTCLQSLLSHEGYAFDLKDDDAARTFFNKQIHPNPDDLLNCSLTPRLPVVGIGAPAAAWLPPMAERLKVRLIIPDFPEVANAIGSAVGRIMESVKILINPGENGEGFSLYSVWEMRNFDSLEEAVDYGKTIAASKAKEAALEDGAVHVEITLRHEDVFAESGAQDKDIYIESRIEAIATERPEWDREESKERFFVDTRSRGMSLSD